MAANGISATALACGSSSASIGGLPDYHSRYLAEPQYLVWVSERRDQKINKTAKSISARIELAVKCLHLRRNELANDHDESPLLYWRA